VLGSIESLKRKWFSPAEKLRVFQQYRPLSDTHFFSEITLASVGSIKISQGHSCLQHDIHTRESLFRGNAFGRIVADSVLAGHKDHCEGADFIDVNRIVPGSISYVASEIAA
jgi:hypothetical protein